MIDLFTIRGIVLLVLLIVLAVSIVVLVVNAIRLVCLCKEDKQLKQALAELDTMPINEWEEKWGEFVQKGYDKCDDPHRDEVENDMKFFKECRKED